MSCNLRKLLSLAEIAAVLSIVLTAIQSVPDVGQPVVAQVEQQVEMVKG